MDRQQFKEFVARLEIEAQADPQFYKQKVGAIAVLGYAYVLGILALVGFGIFALIANWHHVRSHAAMFKLLILFAVVGFVIIKALWIKIPKPEGIEITASDAPEFFRFMNEIREQARVDRVDHVLVQDMYNLAVVQQPRFGIFGGYENYLLLGLPWMESTSKEQLRADLAHEFGHLSGGHGKFSSWLYRLRSTWLNLEELTEADDHDYVTKILFKPFCSWYTPKLNAYSMVMLRKHEIHADHLSIAIAGPKYAAMSLVSPAVRGHYLNEVFWSEVWKRVHDQPEPPRAVYEELAERIKQPVDRTLALAWLEKALAEPTSCNDTHPCLHERLEIITHPENGDYSQNAESLLDEVLALEVSSADELFGPFASKLRSRLQDEWYEGLKIEWAAKFEEVQVEKQRFSELSAKPAAELTVDEHRELASLQAAYGERTAAIALLEKLSNMVPQDASVFQSMGYLLLKDKDERGIKHLERAMELDPLCRVECFAAINDFLRDHNRHEDAEVYLDRAYEAAEVRHELVRKAYSFSNADKFEVPDVAPEKVALLQSLMAQHDEIKRAWLVKKRLPEELKAFPVYLVVLDVQWPSLKLVSSDAEINLRSEIAEQLETGWWVFSAKDMHDPLSKFVKKQGVAVQVYDAKVGVEASRR